MEIRKRKTGPSVSVNASRSAGKDANWFVFEYKVNKCPRGNKCRDRILCGGYHREKERRRDPRKFKYDTMPCPEVKPGAHHHWMLPHYCSNGDACNHTHTLLETMHHPLLYKSTLCVNYMENKQCDWGPYCSHAHGPEDLNDGTWFVKDGANPKSYQYCRKVIHKKTEQNESQQQKQVAESNNPWKKERRTPSKQSSAERRRVSKPPGTFASYERPDINGSFSSMTLDTSGDSRDKGFSSGGSTGHRESVSSNVENRNATRLRARQNSSLFSSLSDQRMSQDSGTGSGFNSGYDQNRGGLVLEDAFADMEEDENEKKSSYFHHQPFLFGQPMQSAYPINQPFSKGSMDSNSPNDSRFHSKHYSPISAGKQQQQIRNNSPKTQKQQQHQLGRGNSSSNNAFNQLLGQNPLGGGTLGLPSMNTRNNKPIGAGKTVGVQGGIGLDSIQQESSSFFSSAPNTGTINQTASSNNNENEQNSTSPLFLDQPFQTPFSNSRFGFLNQSTNATSGWNTQASIPNIKRDDFYLCHGCQINKRGYCLIPCGHIVCQNCSMMQICPICQKKKENIQQVQW